MPKIEVLVGMVGSGKSTYARRRADEGAIVVCHDDLTQMLHGRYRYEQGLRDFYRKTEEAIVCQALANDKDVIVDRTHLTVESRERWVKFVRNLRWDNGTDLEIIAVAFPIESAYEHAVRRYRHDNRGRPFHEWLRVALHHERQAQKEPLGDDEGFSEIIRLT